MVNSGYLFLWVDKFQLAEGLNTWFSDKMYIIDFITWNKQKIGMGIKQGVKVNTNNNSKIS